MIDDTILTYYSRYRFLSETRLYHAKSPEPTKSYKTLLTQHWRDRLARQKTRKHEQNAASAITLTQKATTTAAIIIQSIKHIVKILDQNISQHDHNHHEA